MSAAVLDFPRRRRRPAQAQHAEPAPVTVLQGSNPAPTPDEIWAVAGRLAGRVCNIINSDPSFAPLLEGILTAEDKQPRTLPRDWGRR